NYMGGFEDRTLLNSLVGVKYIFSKNPIKQPGLVFIKKVNGIDIYQNKTVLPMGFLYNTVINPKWFSKLKKEQKDKALFVGVLLDEPWIMAQAEVNKKADILAQLPIINHISMDQSRMDEKVRQLQQTAVQIEQFEQENIKGWFEAKNKSVLFFSIPYNRGWKASIDEQKATIMSVNNGFIGIPVKTGKHRIRLSFEPYGKKVGTYLSISTLFIVGVLSLYKRHWMDV
ncbi:MAG: YfhO family protein, partial [Thermodesulfobacteriota bacterium]|nr:YfhO family protein [Thermodesulfobacteriota bacterium]